MYGDNNGIIRMKTFGRKNGNEKNEKQKVTKEVGFDSVWDWNKFDE